MNSDENKRYVCIDLKSFYASVECRERGLNPLTTNLVVADLSRTEKTVCLAVTPSLKSYGISGRARLFEVIESVKSINRERLKYAKNHEFTGKSYDDTELKANKDLELDYIVATPRMKYYMNYSSKVVDVYLKYVCEDDLLVYSVDEVFIDLTSYLETYKKSAWEIATMMIADVYETTGVTATAGIGTNMYLAKIAMDIVAKKAPADKNGVRIAELNERKYREKMWSHTPLTSFWRIGRSMAEKLEKNGMYTMGDVAACSIGSKYDHFNEDLLYKLFGVNAELLIDHAWGWEPCTIADVKQYEPMSNSRSIGQVLHTPYTNEKARLIVREMTEVLVLELVEKKLLTNQITLVIGYDKENFAPVNDDKSRRHFGVQYVRGSHSFKRYTSSTREIVNEMLKIFDEKTDKNLTVRRVNVTAENVVGQTSDIITSASEQLDFETMNDEYLIDEKKAKKEKAVQQTMIDIKRKYGKNAILKGMNLEEGATTRERNEQVGGHKE